METLVKVFTSIKNESSRTGKEKILEENKGNRLFRRVLEFVYNPFTVTRISTKKLKKKLKGDFDVTVPYTIDGLMKYLLENNSGRDIDIYVVQECIKRAPTEESKEFIRQLATKDLKIGITSKTINKVYGKGTIPEFALMLAESYEKKESKVKGKFYITQKLDGNRCIAIREENDVKFFTRKGQPIDGMKELEEEIMKFPVGWVLDGELLLVNTDNLPSDELFRSTQKVVRKDGKKKNLEFYVFDALPASEFNAGKSKKNYEQRRNNLELLFNNLDEEPTFTKLLPTLYAGDDKNMISVLMRYAEENNWEGLMVNTADGLYQTKRTSDLLKVKKMKTADLLVMGMEEGSGKYSGKLGAILVEYKGGITKVGSGFTDYDREYFWNNQNEIVGRIVETQFFEESMDEKTKQPSLRFPIFKCVRLDKGVDDIRYE